MTFSAMPRLCEEQKTQIRIFFLKDQVNFERLTSREFFIGAGILSKNSLN